MFELVQVTAQYSNAVLVAILPHISDFARKLDLPVPMPITVHQVAQFKCWPVKNEVGGPVTLTNGLWISYLHGHVTGFRTPLSYYNLQDAREIPRFYGELRLDKEQALQMARSTITNLGYTLVETFTDQEPLIEMPPRFGDKVVPHYRFDWNDPVFGTTAVSVEIDAGRKVVQAMNLQSPYLRRNNPKIAIEPRLAKASANPKISATESNQFVAAILPKISGFARKLDIAFQYPLTGSQIDRIVFVSRDVDIRIRLTNGYWFRAQRGFITEFNAPDSVYGRQPPALEPSRRPVADFLGQWRLNEKDAIALVHDSIRKLGYKIEDFAADRKPDVLKPKQVGKYIVPRYYFRWLTNDPATSATVALVRAEVDADKGRLLHLELKGPPIRLPRDSNPNSSVGSQAAPFQALPKPPISLPTNGSKELLIDAEAIRRTTAKMVPATNLPAKASPASKPSSPYE